MKFLHDLSESWEAAARSAVTEAAKTVHNISVYAKHMQAIVEGDKITKYRVNAKISFVVKARLGIIFSHLITKAAGDQPAALM